MNIREFIKERRTEEGLSQIDLAADADLASLGTVSNIERGAKPIKLREISQIFRALGHENMEVIVSGGEYKKTIFDLDNGLCGHRVKEIRKDLKLKQANVAAAVGVKQSTVAQIEQKKDIKFIQFARYMSAMGLKSEIVIYPHQKQPFLSFVFSGEDAT